MPPDATRGVHAPRALLRALAVLAFAFPLAGPVAAEPDTEGDGVAALLEPGAHGEPATPSDEALAALLAEARNDPWRLVEHLLAHDRQKLAIALSRRTREVSIGPLLPYAEARDAARGGAARARALGAARAALEAGSLDAALAQLDQVRAVPGGVSVFGAEAAALRGDCLPPERGADRIEAWITGGEEALRIGWWRGADRFFTKAMGEAYVARSLALLQRAAEGARALLELRGDPVALGAAEQNLGSISLARGDLPGALRHCDEALGLYESLGRTDDVAEVRSLRSWVSAEIGDFPAAIEDQRALTLHFADRPRAAAWSANQLLLGMIRTRVGDEQGAFAALNSALEQYRLLGDRDGEANAYGNLGVAHVLAGRWPEAIEAYRAALALLEAGGDPIGVAAVRNNTADVLRRSAEADLLAAERAADAAERGAARARAQAALGDAQKLVEQAVTAAQETGAAGLGCEARFTLGQILLAQGKPEEAIRLLEPVRDEATRLRAWNVGVGVTVTLARARHRLKDGPQALREARVAVEQLATGFGSLGEADFARARALVPDVYDLGAMAAVRTKSPDDLAYFLEAGRAAALLRGLGGRAAALRATVPEELLQRLAERSRAKVEAFTAWHASRSETLADVRALSAKYEERRREELKALEEVSAAQATASGRLAPSRLVSISDLRARLRSTSRPGLRQVFALWNFQDATAVALLVEESGARFVSYPDGDLGALRAALATLGAARDGSLDAAALATVSKLLIDPLKIPAGPTRLFVCPDRDLAYVPLSALLPDDWEVVWEPSATTYDLLAERRLRRGQAVLGLGDPDYHTTPDPDALATRGGPRLNPLPGTRAEVEAITGQPADRRLLGAQATERGLERALEAGSAERPWKSVHLACHGLVDVEWPALSCLAVTPGDGEDGFLTSSEVLRLALRTDLTVLSACQTGRGKFVRGEGVMSLTRAFMFAGSPRVIVSLWDVDDAATAFLMQAFYREWNAGRGTAQALRLAQLAVRDHEVAGPAAPAGKPPEPRKRPWADPKYWAAWVLWGLPD